MAEHAAPAKPPPSHTHVEVARWATLLLIIFMVAVAASPFMNVTIDPSGKIAAFVNEWIYVVLMAYLVIQFDETSRRSATNMKAFIIDNGLALVAILVGFAVLLLWLFRPGYELTKSLSHIIAQCTITSAFDFYYGIVFSQRIAFAGKEREEEVTHR